jgi:hypothetical protein
MFWLFSAGERRQQVITSSGAKCDVCGNYILPISEDEMVNSFGIDQFPGMTFHCDNKCKEAIIATEGDWTKLPPGPIRKAYEDATIERK